MADLAGRSYIPKLYRISKSRTPVVDLLLKGIKDGGGRVVSCSFPAKRLAPIFIGVEDGDNHRYGLLVYPFTTTRRATRNRPSTEHRFQIRYGDPERVRLESNPVGHDPAGVDITLILAVDPETGIIVGLDPLVYAQLPMGISGYYRDTSAEAVRATGWAWWAREKTRPRTPQGDGWDGLESMVGFRPDRLLDYARFEALATSLGFDTGLRLSLAEHFVDGRIGRHDLETLYGVSAATILDIIDSNFRLGVAVRGSVVEHHLVLCQQTFRGRVHRLGCCGWWNWGMSKPLRVRRLTDREGRELQRIVRRGSGSSDGSVVRWRRALVVLASAGGNTVPVIARLAATSPDRVREMIRRFNELGMASLDPRWAGGRPRRITTDDEAFIVDTATARPEALGLPFTRWSLRKLAAYLRDGAERRFASP